MYVLLYNVYTTLTGVINSLHLELCFSYFWKKKNEGQFNGKDVIIKSDNLINWNEVPNFYFQNSSATHQ